VKGVPVAGSGISAIAINLQIIAPATAHGHLRAWTTGQTEPTTTSSLNFDTSDTRSNLTIVPSSGDGRISLHKRIHRTSRLRVRRRRLVHQRLRGDPDRTVTHPATDNSARYRHGRR
jgi:hypothetical protein